MAANGQRQRPPAAKDARTLRSNWGTCRLESQMVEAQHPSGRAAPRPRAAPRSAVGRLSGHWGVGAAASAVVVVGRTLGQDVRVDRTVIRVRPKDRTGLDGFQQW
jgi:hypothetical protein